MPQWTISGPATMGEQLEKLALELGGSFHPTNDLIEICEDEACFEITDGTQGPVLVQTINQHLTETGILPLLKTFENMDLEARAELLHIAHAAFNMDGNRYDTEREVTETFFEDFGGWVHLVAKHPGLFDQAVLDLRG